MTDVARRLAGTSAARWALHRLEDWRPWVAVLVIAMIAVNVWTLTIYHSQIRDETARSAEHVANADAQFHSCLRSIPILTKINLFITGIAAVEAAQIVNAEALVAATSPDATELLRVRQANLGRLRDALTAADNVEFTVPTYASCVALRERLLNPDLRTQSAGSSETTSSRPS